VYLAWNYPLNRFFVFARPRPLALSREESGADRRRAA
jgi:hypothetical protein